MKRRMCLLLSAALLLLTIGCAREVQEETESYSLYFLEAEPEMVGVLLIVKLLGGVLGILAAMAVTRDLRPANGSSER